MRILHVSSLYPPHQVGGAEKSVQLLAEMQVQAGHEVYVACANREDVPWETVNGVHVKRVRHENAFWFEDAPKHSLVARQWAKFYEGFNVAFMRRFDHVMGEVKPDVVNTQSMLALTPLIWKAAAKRRIPVVHTLRDFDLMCRRSSLLDRGKTCESRCLACKIVTGPKAHLDRYVDAVIGNSIDILQTHVKHGYFSHVPEDRRLAIWNARNTSPKPRTVDPARPITFGFLGRISREKGLDTIISACRLLPPSGWQVLIGGRLPEAHDFLPDLGKDLPVKFLGWVDPEKFIGEDIDVLVVPSIWAEPLARVIIEAYAHGVPVIGTAIGGTTELIGRDSREWLYPPGDAKALSEHMRRIIETGRPVAIPKDRVEFVLSETEPRVVLDRYIDAYSRAVRAVGRH